MSPGGKVTPRPLRGFSLVFIIILDMLSPLAFAQGPPPIPGYSYGDTGAFDFTKFNPDVVIVSQADYDALIFTRNSSQNTFTPTQTLKGSMLTFRCRTGVQGNFISFTSTGGSNSSVTYFVDCGTKVISQSYEVVFWVPLSMSLLHIHTDFPIQNTGDQAINSVYNNVAQGTTPIVVGPFTGVTESSVFKRDLGGQQVKVEAEPGMNWPRFETGESPPPAGGGRKGRRDVDPNSESLKDAADPKPLPNGFKSYGAFEGDIYKHAARSQGLADELEFVRVVPPEFQHAAGDRKKMADISRKSRGVWRMKGQGDPVQEHSSNRAFGPLPKGATMSDSGTESGQQKRGADKPGKKGPQVDTMSGMWDIGQSAKGRKRSMAQALTVNPRNYKIPKGIVDRLASFIKGQFVMPAKKGETEEDTTLRTARNIIKDIATGIVAEKAADGDVIRKVGGACNDLNFLSGALLATVDDCQFQAIESLGADVNQVKADVAGLKDDMKQIVNVQIETIQALQQTQQVVDLVNQRVTLLGDELTTVQNAQVDAQYQFADLSVAALKTSAAIQYGQYVDAKQQISIEKMAYIQDQNAQSMSQAFQSGMLLVQEQNVLLKNEIAQSQALVAAANSDAFARVFNEILKERLDRVNSIAESFTSLSIVSAQNVDQLNTIGTQIQEAINSLLQVTQFHTQEISDLRTMTKDIGQLITGIGTSAAQYFIFRDTLTGINITDTTATGDTVSSNFQMLVSPNGVEPNDLDQLTAQELWSVSAVYLDPVAIDSCLASQQTFFTDAVRAKMASTTIFSIEVPSGVYQEFVQQSYAASVIPSTDLAQAPFSIPAQAPSYYLVGTHALGSVYIYYDGTGVAATTNQATANQWSLGVLSSRSLQTNDCVRSLAAGILTITGSSSFYLSWTTGDHLQMANTPSPNIFMFEPITGNMTAAGSDADAFQTARNEAYLIGSPIRQNAGLYLNPITVDQMDQYLDAPVDILTSPVPVLYIGATAYTSFSLVLSSVPALNDTGIIEVPLTEAQLNQTVTPVSVRHAGSGSQGPSSAGKARSYESGKAADTKATVAQCFGSGIIESPTFYPSGDLLMAASPALASQFKTCRAKPGCAHYQGVVNSVIQVVYTDNSTTTFPQTLTFDSGGLTKIYQMIAPPTMTLTSQSYLAGTDPSPSNNYHCSSASAQCAYAIAVVGCTASQTSCSQIAKGCGATSPQYWSDHPSWASGLPKNGDACFKYCMYDSGRRVTPGSFIPRDGFTTSGTGSCNEFQMLTGSAAGKLGFQVTGGYNSDARGYAAGSLDCIMGDNSASNTAVSPNPRLVNMACTSCGSGYGMGQSTTPQIGQDGTANACPVNSGVGTTLIGDHTGRYFFTGSGQPSGSAGATFTATMISTVPTFWSVCMPEDTSLQGIPATSTTASRLWNFPFFFAPNDIGTNNYTSSFNVKFSAFSCASYDSTSCTSDPMIASVCTTRISLDYSAPAINLEGYALECVDRNTSSRCNFTDAVSCVNYAPLNYAGVPIPLCAWTGSLGNGTCREMVPTDDSVRMSAVPTPVISVPCSVRDPLFFSGCASDGLCFQYVTNVALASQCLPVGSPLALLASNWTFPASKTSANLTLNALSLGSGAAGFAPSQCLADGFYCLFVSQLMTLRLYELLGVAYPSTDSPLYKVTCSAITNVNSFDACTFKAVVSNTLGLAGDTAYHTQDSVVSRCAYRPGTVQCADKCEYVGASKNVDGCFKYTHCLSDCTTLECFDALNSEQHCNGLSLSRTDPGSNCCGPTNMCGFFNSTTDMYGNSTSFVSRTSYLNSQCSKVAGVGCGNIALATNDPRFVGATLPAAIANSCVVMIRPSDSICFPAAQTVWCGSGISGCDPYRDVCSTNDTSEISQYMLYKAQQSNCVLYNDKLACLMARRYNTSDPVERQGQAGTKYCVWVKAATGFSYCSNTETAVAKYGTLTPAPNTGVEIYTGDSYFQTFGEASAKLNLTANQMVAVGINPASIVIPPVGVDVDVSIPPYLNKIVMIAAPQFPCPDSVNYYSIGQMCCPVGDSVCHDGNAIPNLSHPKWIYINLVRSFCSVSATMTNNEYIYDSCWQVRYASEANTDASLAYQCLPLVSPTLSTIMFERSNPGVWANQIVTLPGNGGVDKLYMSLVPLKDYSKLSVVDTYTVSASSIPGSDLPGIISRPIYSSNTEPSWSQFTGTVISYMGFNITFDTLLNVTITSVNFQNQQFGLLDIEDSVTAGPSTGWNINSLTGGPSLQYQLDLVRKAYLSSQQDLFGPYPMIYNARMPTGCEDVFNGPGTTASGAYTPKEHHFYCAAYQNRWVPVYMVVQTVVSYTASMVRSDNSDSEQPPVSVTVVEDTPPGLLQNGEMFVFVEDETVQYGAVSYDPQRPYDWAYVSTEDPANFDPTTFISSTVEFHPEFAIGSVAQYQVGRVQGADPTSSARFCGQSVVASFSGISQQLEGFKILLRWDYLQQVAKQDPVFAANVIPLWTDLMVESNVPFLNDFVGMGQDAQRYNQCPNGFHNFIDPTRNSTDFFTYLLLGSFNETTGSLSFDAMKALIEPYAAGRDHIDCGNCILRVDPVTKQPVFDPSNVNIIPHGCNPLYGTTLPPAVNTGGYVVNAFMAFNMPFCPTSLTYNITSLSLTPTGGSMTAKLLSGSGGVTASFTSPKIDSIYQTIASGICPLITNGSEPLVGPGIMQISLTNIVKDFGASVSFVVRTSPPDPATGLLNTTVPIGDPDNYIYEAFVSPLSTNVFPLPILTGVHYIQLFTRTLDFNCSVAITTDISYDSMFVDNQAAVTQVEIQFNSSILTNYQNGDISVEKGLQDVKNEFILQKATVAQTFFTVQADITSITSANQATQTQLTTISTQFSTDTRTLNIQVVPAVTSLQNTVLNITNEQTAQSTLVTQASAAATSALDQSSTAVSVATTAANQFAARDSTLQTYIAGNFSQATSLANQAMADAVALQTALSVSQTPDAFYMSPVGSQITSTNLGFTLWNVINDVIIFLLIVWLGWLTYAKRADDVASRARDAEINNLRAVVTDLSTKMQIISSGGTLNGGGGGGASFASGFGGMSGALMGSIIGSGLGGSIPQRPQMVYAPPPPAQSYLPPVSQTQYPTPPPPAYQSQPSYQSQPAPVAQPGYPTQQPPMTYPVTQQAQPAPQFSQPPQPPQGPPKLSTVSYGRPVFMAQQGETQKSK